MVRYSTFRTTTFFKFFFRFRLRKYEDICSHQTRSLGSKYTKMCLRLFVFGSISAGFEGPRRNEEREGKGGGREGKKNRRKDTERTGENTPPPK